MLYHCCSCSLPTYQRYVSVSLAWHTSSVSSCLMLLPQDVSLHDAAAALCADAEVSLDALIGLICFLSTGSNKDKLQLCFWTLDR